MMSKRTADCRIRGIRASRPRIFVTTRKELTDPEVQKIQAAQSRDTVDIRLAFRKRPDTTEQSVGTGSVMLRRQRSHRG